MSGFVLFATPRTAAEATDSMINMDVITSGFDLGGPELTVTITMRVPAAALDQCNGTLPSEQAYEMAQCIAARIESFVTDDGDEVTGLKPVVTIQQ